MVCVPGIQEQLLDKQCAFRDVPGTPVVLDLAEPCAVHILWKVKEVT